MTHSIHTRASAVSFFGLPSSWLNHGLVAALALYMAAADAVMVCPSRVRIGFPDVGVSPIVHGSGYAFAQPPGELVSFIQRAMADAVCKPELVLSRLLKQKEMLQMFSHRQALSTSGGYGELWKITIHNTASVMSGAGLPPCWSPCRLPLRLA